MIFQTTIPRKLELVLARGGGTFQDVIITYEANYTTPESTQSGKCYPSLHTPFQNITARLLNPLAAGF